MNVLLRFIAADVPELGRRATRLLRRAEDGSIVLHVAGVVVAEIVWVLGSFYGLERSRIAETLRSILVAEGLIVEDKDIVLEALRIMGEANVAYVDAHIAARAGRLRQPVATFDRDFRRLGVDILEGV